MAGIFGLVYLVILFVMGAVACFVGGIMVVAGVKVGTKIFGPVEIRMLDNHAKTFE